MRHLRHLAYLLSVTLFTASAFAQAPATKVPVKATPVTNPALEVTPLEKAGLQQIMQEYQQVLQQLSQANIDAAKNHPGYHLDPQNPLSGKLVKDENEKPAEKK